MRRFALTVLACAALALEPIAHADELCAEVHTWTNGQKSGPIGDCVPTPFPQGGTGGSDVNPGGNGAGYSVTFVAP